MKAAVQVSRLPLTTLLLSIYLKANTVPVESRTVVPVAHLWGALVSLGCGAYVDGRAGAPPRSQCHRGTTARGVIGGSGGGGEMGGGGADVERVTAGTTPPGPPTCCRLCLARRASLVTRYAIECSLDRSQPQALRH